MIMNTRMHQSCKSVCSSVANPFRLHVKVILGSLSSHAVDHGPKRIIAVDHGSNKYSFLFIALDDCRFLGCPQLKIKIYLIDQTVCDARNTLTIWFVQFRNVRTKGTKEINLFSRTVPLFLFSNDLS